MPISMRNCCYSLVSDTLFTYTTVKVVKVPNTFIAVINRILQLIIFAYIAFYIVWIKNGYQEFQEPRGTSIIKVKGIAKITSIYNDSTSDHLWDTAEYQIPPLENNAFFIATRQIITYDQKVESCSSALDDKLFCNSTTVKTTCPANQPTPNTFGYFTGECINNKENNTIGVCEIKAWCPEEVSNSTELVMNSNDLKDFTVYLKTMVTFTLFNINMRNVRDDTNFSCRYDKDNDPRCPIFRIGDILDGLNTNKTALLLEGGLIEIRQKWQCNFDYNQDRCYPTYDFSVLQSGDDKNSPGVNYRSAVKNRENGQDYRTLSKIFGLRFVVAITGNGGQFNIVNLFIAIGSGIGFMVIAGIVCDTIFMYFHKYRERYREGKFSVCEVTEKISGTNEDLKKNNGYSIIEEISNAK